MQKENIYKNCIYLEPQGGLANRMRVIASGLKLANYMNMKLIVVWGLNNDLNCVFDDLFVPIKNMSFVNKRLQFYFFRSKEQKSYLKMTAIRFLELVFMRNHTVLEDADVLKIKKGEVNIGELAKSSKKLYFRTCSEFGDVEDEIKLFKPIGIIQNKINNYCRSFDQKTIGIHIRRTDHVIAIEQSPMELFVDKIQKILCSDSETKFFLSTDDEETIMQLKAQFGDRILSIEKEFLRTTKQGIQDAVLDMYCLANTSMIYGSYWSSFSQMAARINGVPFEAVKLKI